ncbi:hypothetical protein [Neobacillus mesonae]|uniref:hypothetical protein n=1 Tax=Neobacillus mesonae TaxID=1193713 RepID=UPI000A93C6C4|nr:hypothetical protein [Neobacillus mesonae]MED4206424.1 hypothetical protein [Neobacillus mesonae]
MKTVSQEYLFTTYVTDSQDPNEFMIELFSSDADGNTLVQVTKNFDELIDFLEKLT